MEQEIRNQLDEDGSEEISLGTAVADLVENVIANALRIAEDAANDSVRVARSAREFVRNLQDA